MATDNLAEHVGFEGDEPKVINFDMDGTLAEFEEGLQADLDKLRGPDEAHYEVFTPDLPPHIENRCRLIKSQPGWWLNLKRRQLGFDIWNLAVKEIGFHPNILTKGPKHTPLAWSEKLLWSQRELGMDIEVTITFKKGRVYGRALVDDFPQYALEWLEWRPRGVVIMPVCRSNAGFSHPKVVLYDGSGAAYEAVKKALLHAYSRK